jgi:hypothetical protein
VKIWTAKLNDATRDLGRIVCWIGHKVDETRQTLAADVRSRAREVAANAPRLNAELTPMQSDFLSLIYSRCGDYDLSKHPVVAAWLDAYREA